MSEKDSQSKHKACQTSIFFQCNWIDIWLDQAVSNRTYPLHLKTNPILLTQQELGLMKFSYLTDLWQPSRVWPTLNRNANLSMPLMPPKGIAPKMVARLPGKYLYLQSNWEKKTKKETFNKADKNWTLTSY